MTKLLILCSYRHSRETLSFLCTIIQFDNSRLRKEPWSAGKFAAFWDFFEHCNKQFIELSIPSHTCATDEILCPYRVQIGRKQYNPSKPAKFGLLWRALCDSIAQCTYFSLAYAGKLHSTWTICKHEILTKDY